MAEGNRRPDRHLLGHIHLHTAAPRGCSVDDELQGPTNPERGGGEVAVADLDAEAPNLVFEDGTSVSRSSEGEDGDYFLYPEERYGTLEEAQAAIRGLYLRGG